MGEVTVLLSRLLTIWRIGYMRLFSSFVQLSHLYWWGIRLAQVCAHNMHEYMVYARSAVWCLVRRFLRSRLLCKNLNALLLACLKK